MNIAINLQSSARHAAVLPQYAQHASFLFHTFSMMGLLRRDTPTSAETLGSGHTLGQRQQAVHVLASSSKSDHEEMRMNARLERIQAHCGALCDTRRPIFGESAWSVRYGYTSAPVDCTWLLADDTGIDVSREQAIAPKRPPARWFDEFTMHGRYPFVSQYFDDSIEALAGNAMDGASLSETNITRWWDIRTIRKWVHHARTGTMWTRYHGLNIALWQGIQYANVTGRVVLVIGSQTPWVEALCLGAGASHVVTLEYAKIVTNHPQITALTPATFKGRAREGLLPRFDCVVTASSVEHSGLGRYNDGLNPWGDILAVARGWCVSAPSAKLVIAVPMTMDWGKEEPKNAAQAKQFKMDRLGFNGARTYGPVRYPYLTTNWRFAFRANYSAGWGHSVYVFNRHDAPPR